jgi:hypothetical protein
VGKKRTITTQSTEEDEASKCLFRECISYSMVINVAVIENVVGVPLRRVFRYARTGVTTSVYLFALPFIYKLLARSRHAPQ